jgi:uncharacterized membrane protein
MLLLTTEAYWQVFGRFHPLLIHFPLALILAAAFIELSRYVLGRRDHPSSAASVCLWMGLILGGAALWAGWVLADSSGEEGSVLTLHRWTGVATIGILTLAAAALLMRQWKGRNWAAPHIGLTMLAAVMVAVCGHFGGEMVWGEGWIFAPLNAKRQQVATSPTPPMPPALLAPPTAVVEWSTVEPILIAHCQKCHGPKRQKDGLQLVPWEKMFEGDVVDWVVQPGDAASSRMFARITLSADHEDIMPPADDNASPLSSEQIQLLVEWINGGAIGPAGQKPPTPQPEPVA